MALQLIFGSFLIFLKSRFREYLPVPKTIFALFSRFCRTVLYPHFGKNLKLSKIVFFRRFYLTLLCLFADIARLIKEHSLNGRRGFATIVLILVQTAIL
jgi:hypothetical protein